MTNTNWTFSQKTSFRFASIFIITFIILFNNGAYPLFNYVIQPIEQEIYKCLTWFAKNIISYSGAIETQNTGSGDSTYAWFTLISILIVAIIGSIIWSILDRNRKNYDVFYYWLITFIRYYIAFMLINYGTIKLTHSQMLPPGLNRLMQPLGEFSPMGLAWTYFGYSYGYNIFVGIAEILAGLLLFRKTIVLGALVTAAVSINIMSTNYFFDVPVKITSTALLLLSIFILLPYIQSLYDFFIREKPAQIISYKRPKYDKKWKNKLILIVKISVLVIFGIQQINGLLNRHKFIEHYLKKSPLYGIYHIEKEGTAPLPNGWQSIIFEYEGNASVRDTYYKSITIAPTIDTVEKKLSLNNHTYNYEKLKNGDIRLTKTIDNRIEEIKFIRKKEQDFELMKRKFNWVQDYPYNR
ncbi:DoxX family protein [Sphingobacterium sp. UT-1RO-CII-1]|uniref:DoxX family protein n=1 Tax=Sphingobacterium sp. UT-1RO-CII-1 TaxID=2995225 RepID=UPI00227A3CF9|nr:DoxX family protein [Sphingobacterium sp. UT-1RO-CII-1]MCY4780257.1 DoxX family protein [Sphingobacterium sp. UT-1RO-CII-1]